MFISEFTERFSQLDVNKYFFIEWNSGIVEKVGDVAIEIYLLVSHSYRITKKIGHFSLSDKLFEKEINQ